MKKNLFVVMAAMTLVIAMVGGVGAVDTANVTATANIADTCTTINAGTVATIALNPMNDVAMNNQSVFTSAPTINCTSGSTHQVSCTGSGVLSDGTNNINYSIVGASSACTAFGVGGEKNIAGAGSTAVSLPLVINISSGYGDYPAGNYTDAVQITVNY